MAENGAYLLLLIAMWRAGGYLPNDDARLARFCRSKGNEWLKVKPTVMEFFKVEGDRITQGRLLEELEKARGRSKKAAESARSKYRKTNDVVPANADPEHSSTAASISISIDTAKKAPSSPKKGTRIPEDFAPDLDAAVTAGLRPERALVEAAKFRDYWLAVAGAKGVKLDWPATWRNWVRSAVERQPARGSPGKVSAFREHQQATMAEFEKRVNGNGSEQANFYDDDGPTIDIGKSDYRSR